MVLYILYISEAKPISPNGLKQVFIYSYSQRFYVYILTCFINKCMIELEWKFHILDTSKMIL